jgi:hypothetical protein
MTTTQTPESVAYQAQPVQPQPPQTLSILSLIAGISSLVFGLTFVVPVGAIVLGFLARTREPASRSMANWGIVLGFVSLFGWLLLLVPLLLVAPFFLFAFV